MIIKIIIKMIIKIIIIIIMIKIIEIMLIRQKGDDKDFYKCMNILENKYSYDAYECQHY